MALPASPNTITMGQVNTELGLSATATIGLNDAAVRTLAGVGGSGSIISMSNLHGKSAAVETTLGFNNGSNFLIYGEGTSSAYAGFTFETNGTIIPQYPNQYGLTYPSAYFSPAPTTGGGSNYEISITVTEAPNLNNNLSFLRWGPVNSGTVIGVGTTGYTSLSTRQYLELTSDVDDFSFSSAGTLTIRRGGSTITRNWTLTILVGGT